MSLFLLYKSIHLYRFSRFHIYVLIYDICFSVFDLFHCVWRKWQPTPVFLPGESPWKEEPGGLQSMGSQRVRYDWATKHTHTQKMLVKLIFKSRHRPHTRKFEHSSLKSGRSQEEKDSRSSEWGGWRAWQERKPPASLSRPSFKLLLQPLALNLWVETHRLQRVASENPASWKRTIDFSRQSNSKEKKKVFLNYAFQLGQENNSCHIFG